MRALRSIATPSDLAGAIVSRVLGRASCNNGAQGFRMLTTFRAACELKRKLRTALFAAVLLSYAAAAATAIVTAQEHPPAAPSGEHAHAAGEHDESIGGMSRGMLWPVANFIVFVGVLYYFFNQPLKDYLAGRSATIRKDLVEAAELRSNATAQLASIEQKLQALPGEIERAARARRDRDRCGRTAHRRRRRRRSRTAARTDAT